MRGLLNVLLSAALCGSAWGNVALTTGQLQGAVILFSEIRNNIEKAQDTLEHGLNSNEENTFIQNEMLDLSADHIHIGSALLAHSYLLTTGEQSMPAPSLAKLQEKQQRLLDGAAAGSPESEVGCNPTQLYALLAEADRILTKAEHIVTDLKYIPSELATRSLLQDYQHQLKRFDLVLSEYGKSLSVCKAKVNTQSKTKSTSADAYSVFVEALVKALQPERPVECSTEDGIHKARRKFVEAKNFWSLGAHYSVSATQNNEHVRKALGVIGWQYAAFSALHLRNILLTLFPHILPEPLGVEKGWQVASLHLSPLRMQNLYAMGEMILNDFETTLTKLAETQDAVECSLLRGYLKDLQDKFDNSFDAVITGAQQY